MRAIVTGGAGFVGSHLAERLHRDGHEVLVIDNLSSGTERLEVLSSQGITIDTTDIRQERLLRVIGDFAPAAILHLAAQIDVRVSVADPIHDAKVNIVGTLRVLEAARQAGARVVFSSSGGTIYGEAEPPTPEDSTGLPTSPYGISKRVADDYLRFYRDVRGLEFVSLALANIYGPRQDPHGEAGVVAIFANKLLRREPCTIYGDGKQTRDFLFVDDAVEAFIRGLDKGEGERINVGSGVETTIADLYAAMASIAQVEADPLFEPERPGELQRSALDIRKAKAVLGWQPRVGLEEGLGRTIESFRTR